MSQRCESEVSSTSQITAVRNKVQSMLYSYAVIFQITVPFKTYRGSLFSQKIFVADLQVHTIIRAYQKTSSPVIQPGEIRSTIVIHLIFYCLHEQIQ